MKPTVNESQTPAADGAAECETLVRAIGELWQRPGFLMRRCLQQTSGHFEQSCAEIGLTARQYDYLFVLNAVGQLGQGELGSTLGLDRSTNALVLKILERKAWVQRVVVATDTRRRLVQITPEGRRTFLAARKAAEGSIQTITSALSTEEYQLLLSLMRKVVQAGMEQGTFPDQGLSPA